MPLSELAKRQTSSLGVDKPSSDITTPAQWRERSPYGVFGQRRSQAVVPRVAVAKPVEVTL